jgi:hypothetical protein
MLWWQSRSLPSPRMTVCHLLGEFSRAIDKRTPRETMPRSMFLAFYKMGEAQSNLRGKFVEK